MMKRIFAIALLSFMLLWVAPALTVFATENGEGGDAPKPSAAGESPTVKSKIDNVFPSEITPSGGTKQSLPLPTGEFKKTIVPKAIRLLLALGGIITTGVFVYAGVMLVIAQGNEEDITKFKNILIWSIVGLVFITTAYAIVRGILQLSFE